MRDPTIPNPDTRKKIMFYDSEERQVKLRIKCGFDGLNQSQFFRMMITGYIENDELLYGYLKRAKERYNVQGQQKRNKIEQLYKNKKDSKIKFALEKGDIEDIFDIIEVETGL
jgi:hypothetical protein